jgi:hypothetical protein
MQTQFDSETDEKSNLLERELPGINKSHAEKVVL